MLIFSKPTQSITCLLQYCSGRAKSLLQCCLVKEPAEGYKLALDLLEEIFGNQFVIAQEWVKRITNRPDVKGTLALREFADDLRCCQETLKTMGYASEMDNSHSMLAIVEKLPYHLQTRWLRENHNIKIRERRNSQLSDLVDFIALAADEASDPVFVKVLFKDIKKDRLPRPKADKRQTGSFAVQASPTPNAKFENVKPKNVDPCLHCGRAHYITQCMTFKALRVKDRRAFIISKGLCVNCFKPGHFGKDCPRPFTCSVDGCGQKHSKFLHIPSRRPNPEEGFASVQTSNQNAPSNLPVTSTVPSPVSVMHLRNQVSNFVRSQGGKVALPIVPLRVRCLDSSRCVDTYEMLDPGTTSTYCKEALSESLGTAGIVKHFELTTIVQTRVAMDCTVISLLVSYLHDTIQSRCIPEVTVRPSLNIDLSGLCNQVNLECWPHLRGLDVPELTDVDQVHLLIGQDCSDLLLPEEVKRGSPGEPYAIRTPLGWAVNGPVDPFTPGMRSSHFVQAQTPMERDLARLWALEDSNSEEFEMSIHDRKVLHIWDNSVNVVNGHYSINIPFKAEEPKMPDNRIMAEHRLRALKKRLDRDSGLKTKYTAEIKQLLDKDYAERVPLKDLDRADGIVWYLPHHHVHNPKKPDKCRIVFDCAAQYKGTSLNENVHQGPDLTKKLVGVLLRFRQDPVAFAADIEGMFHQVKVTPNDRDALRFLWWENDDTAGQTVVLRMTSHLFGGVWSPSCANYALRRVAYDHGEIYPELTLNTILKSFYVDDCLKSVDSLHTAVTLVKELSELLTQRGFNLTKWISNSPELMETIPKEKWGKVFFNLDISFEKTLTERVLGMLWHIETDCFGFDVQVAEKPKTKRGVLSTLSTVYDPLGFVSPFVLKARLIFQQLCRLQKGWDDSFPADMEDQWGRWLADLPTLQHFRIPRCVKPTCEAIGVAQLHHFSDASEHGYGAVSYLRLICGDEIRVNIVMAKARLAPLKGSTIPRLELAGAVEAVKLDKLIHQELEWTLQDSVFWTDSTIVLWYLQNEGKRFQTYVANRVAKILDYTRPMQWRYVPTTKNPGDDASRGMAAEELVNNKRWAQGPDFLQMDESNWPKQPAFKCVELMEVAELKRAPMVYSMSSDPDPVSSLLKFYSSWFRLKKAVAWILRLRKMLLKKASDTGPIKSAELMNAELAIIRYIQKPLQDAESRPLIRKLKPVKSASGLLRVGGKLAQSELCSDSKHQLILPHKHHVSRLIVEECHLRTGHSGVERVLAETCRRYWILRGRQLVKTILSRCIVCKKSRGKPEVQLMSDLPASRLTPYEQPFTRVGIDYFGPFSIKRGRSEVKRYGCLFTCLAIRAVHIEVSHTLDTDSFINALERFIARRGEPHEIRSDNGTNFVGARSELRKAISQWNQVKIHEHLLKRDVKWIFNPPGASHMGGVWERQIRSVRSVMTGILKQQTMDEEALVTLLTVAEGIINGRPITKLSDDPRDDQPLTPNHLLILRSGPVLPPGQFENKDRYRRRWRQVQYLADVFWKRWIREYLPALQERQKWLKPRPNLQKGDLVILCQENTPRNQWPLGLIIDTYPGPDGLVRSVNVRTASGTYERPITKICLLEGSVTEQP